MTYTKTDWKDHVVDNNTGAVIQQGTPVSAKNLNNIEQGVASLFDQLEASKVQQGKLSPGASVINTDVGGPLELVVPGAQRRNILNGDGNFEKDTDGDGVADGWIKTTPNGAFSLQPGALYGLNAQRITSLLTDPTITRYVSKRGIPLVAGKNYIAIANVTTDGVATARLAVYKDGSSGENYIAQTIASALSKVHFVKFTATADTSDGRIYLYNNIDVGNIGWVQWDGAGVYEVGDQALFDRIGVDITEANIREFFPHVDGKQFVQGIAIEKQGRNLVRNFYENGVSLTNGGVGSYKINDPYEIAITNTSAAVTLCYVTLDVLPNTYYAVKFDVCEGIFGVYPDASNVASLLGYRSTPGAFDSGPNTRVRLYMRIEAAGTFRFKNPMMIVGRVADLPDKFEPANPQHLILPVTLAEVSGIRDELAVKGAEAQLVRRVRRDFVIDGSVKTQAPTDNNVGYKAVIVNLPSTSIVGAYARAIRYDGYKFSEKYTTGVGNVYVTNFGLFIVMTVSNSETGWADEVNPNTNAVKALLNGWKANANDGSKYTSWASLLDGKAPATNTEAYVAANKAPGWTAYAVADYALANPELIPNSGEGAISLHQGNNQIMIETGLVYREKVSFNTTTKQGATIQRCRRAIKVYKGYDPEPFTTYTSSGQLLPQLVNDVDTAADYFVTYMVLDKFSYTANVTDVSCTYGANTKTILDRTVSNVAELDTKAMVLTRSVAELYKKVKALGG